jgi:DNA-binding NtrC family response regulator
MNEASAELDTVLIIDTDVVVRASLAAFLRDCGLRVFEANDTVEAKTVMTALPDRIHVVLCDAGSVGTETSFGFVRWVRKHHTSTSVLLAGTVSAAADLAGELCEGGPQMRKPYDPQGVVDAIRQALAARARAKVS